MEDKVQVIWASKHIAEFCPLSFNVTREICLFLPLPLPLACIGSDSLRFFKVLQLGSAILLERSIRTFNESWAVVDANTVLLSILA